MTSQLQSVINVFAGQTASANLSLLGDPRFCQIPEKILFASASSFIDITAPGNLSGYRAVADRISFAPPGELFLVVGHTDDVGDPSDNDPLSERRAEGSLAVLEGGAKGIGVWESNYKKERAKAWDDEDFRKMLLKVTGATPSQTEINQHKEITSGGEAKRAVLFARYFEKLLGVPSGSMTLNTLGKPTLGCGETHALATGTHPPSRRAEFFFFRGTTSPVVDCIEYPGWVTPCGILPRTPPAVKIDPIETIASGSTKDIQVTITPSPLQLGATVTLTLATTSGSGQAEFADSGKNTLEIDRTKAVRVRGVTPSDVADNIRITAKFTDQAAVLDQDDFTIVDAVTIFLQFEVYNVGTHVFDTLPAGVKVDLVDEAQFPDAVLKTRETDARGRVFFNEPAPPDPADIFFVAHPTKFPGHDDLPKEWPTNGWEATDGTPGLQTGFTGGSLGTASTPLVFRIGLDFHGVLRYKADPPPTSPTHPRVGQNDPAPRGVLVKLMQQEIGPDTAVLVIRTQGNGKLEGVSFTAEPDHTFYVHVDLEMEDGDINLPRTRVTNKAFITLGWDSIDEGLAFPDHRSTSIGSEAAPKDFLVTKDRGNVALYQLKILREFGVFLFELTKGEPDVWTGAEIRVFPFDLPFIRATAFSFPVGQLNIPEEDEWNRETLVHEMAHQVMWKQSKVETSDIIGMVGGVAGGLLHLCHTANFLSNNRQALIDGWTEFFEGIFERTATPPHFFLTLEDCPTIPAPCACTTIPGVTLGPGGGMPNNQGERVEGAFANALWGVFESHVVGSARSATHGAHVPEDQNEQVVTDAPWVRDPDVRKRFLSDLWRPLGDLATADKTTTAMIGFMRNRNQPAWHQILPELQAFNIAMRAPTITKVDPPWGPAAGGSSFGHHVIVSGTDFEATKTVPTSGTSFTSQTKVEFDGTAPSTVTVTAGDALTAFPPAHGAGLVPIKVETAAGSATLPNAYLYVDDPLEVLGVTPAVISTLDGGTIEIVGKGFFARPDAEILLNTTAIDPKNVAINSPTKITAKAPPGSAGPVTVSVRNADSSIATLTGALRYADPPLVINMLKPVSRSGPADQNNEIIVLGRNIHPDATVTDGTQSLPITQKAVGSETEVTFILPPGPPGLVKLELENFSDGLSAPFEFLREEVGP